MKMKEVIAIVRTERWQATRQALSELAGVEEVSHRRVLGRGRQKGLRYLRPQSRGEAGGMEFLPKRLGMWLVPDEQVQPVVAALIQVNRTGNYGDGKVFVSPVDSVLDPLPAAEAGKAI